MRVGRSPLVSTRKEKCRLCYACIRECPAKAIRVAVAQASVDFERCIGCGNCVRVCTQSAKVVHTCIEKCLELLDSGSHVVALVAPSFPAEFTEADVGHLVGALKKLGFRDVFEVSFGADLVAREYARILESDGGRFIGSTCPSVVAFIEKYHPDLVPHLMPIVSPMVASARVARSRLGRDVKVVFVGPCIAKKSEAAETGEVDAVLTFAELRELFGLRGVSIDDCESASPTPPLGGSGGLFAVTRGLLQASLLKEDLLEGDVLAAEGNPGFVSAIREFKRGGQDVRFLELLCCNGCIDGVGFTNRDPLLVRRSNVSRFVRQRVKRVARGEVADEVCDHSWIDLSRRFEPDDRRMEEPSEGDLRKILVSMGRHTAADELNCGACGYESCRRCATAIHRGLAEPEMCLPFTIDLLRETIQELENSNQDLMRVREALCQSEKLASMGQMAAGIAHEVNNPLGIVLLYANLMLESAVEGSREREDLRVVVEQAERCRKIVMGLLNFARQNKVFRQQVDVVRLAEDALRASAVPENVSTRVVDALGETGVHASLDADQIQQVLLNLINNAVAAMPSGGDLVLRLQGTSSAVTFSVEDTGTGISKENLGKIFEPFFSTKSAGKGTGLGLAVVHGIVKMHQGRITVESNDNAKVGPTGSRFLVTVPRDEP